MKMLIAGNWKMHGLKADLAAIEEIAAGAGGGLAGAVDLLICPPATLIAAAVERGAGRIAIGAQDCHMAERGAHTGDVSAAMIADAGASAVIVGHSERRTDHGERDALVRAKAKAGQAAGLLTIVCVGETEGERDAGRALPVVEAQLSGSLDPALDPTRLAVAYEPVWAIGTGRTPTAADVGEMHAAIRAALKRLFGAAGSGVRILYGGSVKPDNAATLLGVAEVGGALVGGASLKPADFLAIARAGLR